MFIVASRKQKRTILLRRGNKNGNICCTEEIKWLYLQKNTIMVTKETIREIILDNRKEVSKREIVRRDFSFMDNACYVLIGVRRAGKSYILYQIIKDLLANGHSWDEIVYINFEDERLLEMQTADLNKILEVHQMMSDKQPFLFLDEIQNISGWDKFARRLAENKYTVVVTGSNAKMLSQDVATTLGGKFIIKEIFPYSFKEFLSAKKVKIDENSFYATDQRAEIQKYMREYFYDGGFPESLNYEIKSDYLTSVYQKIYIGDIAARNNIDNIFGLRLMFKKLAENVMHPISFTRLTNVIKSSATAISTKTVIAYSQYSQNAFLLLSIRNIAAKLTDRETAPKLYFVDNGLFSVLAIHSEPVLLENLVAISLLRKYGIDDHVFFYNKNVEVDFVIPEHDIAIQVCYRLRNNIDDTFRRETSALVSYHKYTGCNNLFIITYDEEETIETDGVVINIVPIWKWML